MLLIDRSQSFSLSGEMFVLEPCSSAVCSFMGVWQVLEAHMLKADNSCYFICLSITLHLHTVQLHTASPSYMHSRHDSMCVQYLSGYKFICFCVFYWLLAQIGPRSFSNFNVNVL